MDFKPYKVVISVIKKLHTVKKTPTITVKRNRKNVFKCSKSRVLISLYNITHEPLSKQIFQVHVNVASFEEVAK